MPTIGGTRRGYATLENLTEFVENIVTQDSFHISSKLNTKKDSMVEVQYSKGRWPYMGQCKRNLFAAFHS